MKVNVYSPFDGYVKKIEEISDSAFASKSLGDCVFIIPENNIMTSPLDNAKIELIADTKHAYYFSNKYFNLLVHVGLDTVNLEGKPFELLKTLGDKVSKKSEIMKLDKSSISSHISLETSILIETLNFKKYKINLKKINQTVKQGDLLFEIDFERKEVNTSDLVKMDREINKYVDTAQKILSAIGGKENQTNFYNCMTRLRFKIRNKDLVDETKIKNISIVKGINWAGQELQIIIGGEVYKVRQECSNIIENNLDVKEEIKKFHLRKNLHQLLHQFYFQLFLY
ncbi:PTS glucose transporter subunit IIA [Spiroplasma taiwanense]|uniref:PTS glucose transporter subunit IIA n=1 Tax=Spiroplasma taiwanense TaxID=2145 RepID=UPI000415B5B6|nr:PTS glucose transporter subunit IIA [Spiroplasma taiwanense]